jgi:Aromatic-ring-opening dioxygenase LigAB, LigA subunit
MADGSISDFLTNLCDDPQLRESFSQDPSGTMQSAGLSQDSIEVILSRDLNKIKQAIESEGVFGLHTVCFMIFWPSGHPG